MVNVPRFCSTDSLVIRGIWKSSIRVLTSFWCRTGVDGDVGSGSAAASSDRGAGEVRLLRVQLDDELLLHRRGDLASLRLAQYLGRERLVVGLQPRGNLSGQLGGIPDHLSARSVR